MDLHYEIVQRLGEEDDPKLWSLVCGEISDNVRLRTDHKSKKWPIYLEIGACSHWTAPHQSRVTRAGGFAWPTGYGRDGKGTGRLDSKGLPQFDWSLHFLVDKDSAEWAPVKPKKGRSFVFRVVIPTRTTRHEQAAVNVTWIPHPPESDQEHPMDFYGFRKLEDKWTCVHAPEMKYIGLNT